MLIFIISIFIALSTTTPSSYFEYRLNPLELGASSSLKNYGNFQYVVTMSIGSPSQTIDLLVDTGSSWVLIPSKNCDCHESSHKFDPSSSSTYSSYNSEIDQKYGRGEVTGILSSDKLTLSSLKAYNQTFLLITEEADFDNLQADGVLGLAFNSLSMGYNTLIDTLKSQKTINQRLFSIYLSNRDQNVYSFMTIGGYNTTKYSSENALVVNIEQDFGFWCFWMESSRFGDHFYEDYTLGLFDTGGSMILGPEPEVDMITSQIKEIASCYMDTVLICYCNKSDIGMFPNFEFYIGGQEFIVRPESYVYYKNNLCYVLFDYSYDFYWVLGQPFLREYYSVFDMDQMKVMLFPEKYVRNQKKSFWVLWVLAGGVAGMLYMAKSIFWKKDERVYMLIKQ